eukprot:TRINITY_DN6362_c0_g2_i1.p1 TRINITY_DN6362_c0_g2~~TRINITY_DN6362_c0_g2_i1.p1  ORF type:complete len:126 (+),score=16.05 TRINITY_DN6362_c0_g2_i1:64-441(+)
MCIRDRYISGHYILTKLPNSTSLYHIVPSQTRILKDPERKKQMEGSDYLNGMTFVQSCFNKYELTLCSTKNHSLVPLKSFEIGKNHTSPKLIIYENTTPVSYTHLRAHETGRNLVCRLLLEKKKS